VEIAKYVDGCPLRFDYASHRFHLGDTTVSGESVIADDAAGQILWPDPRVREQWIGWIAAAGASASSSVQAVPAPKSPRHTKRFTTTAALTLGVLFIAIVGLGALGSSGPGERAPSAKGTGSVKDADGSSDASVEARLAGIVKANHEFSRADAEVYLRLAPLMEQMSPSGRERAYSRMSTLKIKRGRRMTEFQEAYYSQAENTVIYCVKPDTEMRAHEAIHVIYPMDSLPKFMREGGVELLTLEYFADDPWNKGDTYPAEIAAVKTLCELVGPDTVLKAFEAGDITVLTAAMAEIRGDQAQAERLLSGLLPHPTDAGWYDGMPFEDSLVEAFDPYFDAKYGPDYLKANAFLGTYEQVFNPAASEFKNLPSKWPAKYYFNPRDRP